LRGGDPQRQVSRAGNLGAAHHDDLSSTLGVGRDIDLGLQALGLGGVKRDIWEGAVVGDELGRVSRTVQVGGVGDEWQERLVDRSAEPMVEGAQEGEDGQGPALSRRGDRAEEQLGVELSSEVPASA
jgi:hypothetical protein